MSLVHEALQKAEREKQRKAGVPSLPPTSSPPSVAFTVMKTMSDRKVQPATRSWPVLFTTLLASVGLVALVAIGTLVMVSRASTRKEPPAPAPVAQTKPAPAAAPPVIPPQPVEPAPAAGFSLTGIMKDPGGQYCAVLNGRVVYEGHVVDGATVKRIERERVTLDVNGRETVVRLF